MRLPADSLIKLFIAQSTLEPLVFTMNPHVLDQVLFSRKRFGANRAREQSLLRVHHPMLAEVALRFELQSAT